MNHVDQKNPPVFCLLIAIFISSFVFAGVVDGFQVLKISPEDQRAVIKTPDGKMQIIKIGDPIGDHGIIKEIAADRVVIEEQIGNETEKVIIRLNDGKQTVVRLKKTGEQSAPLLSPVENEKKPGNTL